MANHIEGQGSDVPECLFRNNKCIIGLTELELEEIINALDIGKILKGKNGFIIDDDTKSYSELLVGMVKFSDF